MSKSLERRLQIMSMVANGEPVLNIAEKTGCSLGVVRRTVNSWGEWKEDPPKPSNLDGWMRSHRIKAKK